MLTSHDAVGAEEPLHEAGLNSVYNPNEIPGIFAKAHSLLSTPASVTAAEVEHLAKAVLLGQDG